MGADDVITVHLVELKYASLVDIAAAPSHLTKAHLLPVQDLES